ncbi:hypothetical protein EAG_05277, partial [Camponotus floridanus]
YKIQCKDCNASYVSQTGRQLHTGIEEHKKHITRNTSSRSVITDHRLDSSHEFKLDEIKVLNNEPIFHKCFISEMLFIKRQNNGLNLQSDTECLHHNY